jgi:hypothetical protein
VPFHNFTFDEQNETIFFEISSNTLINTNLSIEIVYENGTKSVIEPISFDLNRTQFKMQINSELAGRQIKTRVIPFKNITSTQEIFSEQSIGIQLNPDILKLDLEKMSNAFKKNSTLQFEFNVFKNVIYYYYLRNQDENRILMSNQLSILLRK